MVRLGKIVTSCNGCALAKRACDSQSPCSSCSSRHEICTYRRTGQTDDVGGVPLALDGREAVEADLDFLDDCTFNETLPFANPDDSTWLNWDPVLPSSCVSTTALSLQQSLYPASVPPWTPWRTGNGFDFLLNFTRSSGLKTVFNYCRPNISTITNESVLMDPSETSDRLEGSDFWTPSQSSLDFGSEVGYGSPQARVPLQSDPKATATASFGIGMMVEWLEDPLFNQTKDLWNMFRKTVAITPSANGPSTADIGGDTGGVDARYLHFFCPSNIRRFLGFFWDQWYPHCPILHKPSFDATRVPIILLAPMVLLGACMSPSDGDNNQAKVLLDAAETIIFSNPLLSVDLVDRRDVDDSILPLKVMQAAYLICLLQNWEGDGTVKRRIRQQRLIAIIAVSFSDCGRALF